MKKLLLCFALALVSGALSAKSNQVPLEVFAKHPAYLDMKISPSGKYVAFTYEVEDVNQTNLAIIELETKKPMSEFPFGENRHVVDFRWLTDERLFMVVQKRIGWLDGTNPETEWAAANVDGTNRRVLWDFQRSGVSLVSILKDEPEYILVTKRHWADEGKITLMKINVENGKTHNVVGLPESARHTTPGIVGVGVDLEDNIKLAYEYDQGEDEIDPEDDSGFIHYKDTDNEWKRLNLKSKRSRPNVDLLGISADNNKFYFTSDHDLKEEGIGGLFVFDMQAEKVSFIYRHPDVAIRGGVFGTEGQLLGVFHEPGYPEVYYIDNAKNKSEIGFRKGLDAAFKNQYAFVTSYTEDNNLSVIKVRSDRNPGEFYLYNKKKNQLKYFVSSKPEVKAAQMARVEPFIMEARDGLKMYGFLTIPNNVEEKNLPMVVYPHGGPYGADDRWRWDRRAQMLASRGYLVLQVNFRGSGGYGRNFVKAGYKEWGRKMQDDITDATLWAVNTGLADKDRICMHGVSYGGYASMQAVVREPDLYQCSIPDAGPYELKVQLDIADSFRGRPNGSEQKEMFFKQMIDGPKFNEERSPIYHLDKLKADLLIVHGAEDVRVPIENATMLEEALKKQNISYEKLYKDEEGHGFTKEENRIELYQTILDFLEKHIGPGSKPKG